MTTNEYLSVFGTLGGAFLVFIGAWINLQITIAKQTVKIENLEKNHDHFTKIVEQIFQELKEIREVLNSKSDRRTS